MEEGNARGRGERRNERLRRTIKRKRKRSTVACRRKRETVAERKSGRLWEDQSTCGEEAAGPWAACVSEKVQCPPLEAWYWSRRRARIKRPPQSRRSRDSSPRRTHPARREAEKEEGGARGEKENLLKCTEILNSLKEDREKIEGEEENDRKNKGEKKANFILHILLREIVWEKRGKKKVTEKG